MESPLTNPPPPPLVVMVGFPRSGKSTAVRDWYVPNGYSVVSPDTIRRVIHGQSYIQAIEHYVWSVVYIMADSLLASRNKVVIDGTHISHRRRQEWVKRGGVFHHICTPADICIERGNSQFNACDIVPIIEKMYLEFEPLDISEGEISWEPPLSISPVSVPINTLAPQ